MRRFLTTFCVLLPGLCLAAQSVVGSEATDVRAFNEAYIAYQGAKQSGDLEAALTHARRALELGEEVHAKDAKSIAALTFNLGRALREAREYDQARRYLKLALERYETAYGKRAVELVSPLLELGRGIEFDSRDGRNPFRYLKRAQRITAEAEGKDSESYANVSFEAGVILMSRYPRESAKKFLTAAYKTMSDIHGADHPKTGSVAFWLGKYEMSHKKFERAERRFMEAMRGFKNQDREFEKITLSTHAFLVEVYEELGRREAANRHCRAIGGARRWKPNAEPEALFVQSPVYPGLALDSGLEGEALIEFTVDENGFVIDPAVVKTKGNKVFGKAALAVFPKYRFVPKFVDGKPVKSERVNYRVVFKLKR